MKKEQIIEMLKDDSVECAAQDIHQLHEYEFKLFVQEVICATRNSLIKAEENLNIIANKYDVKL